MTSSELITRQDLQQFKSDLLKEFRTMLKSDKGGLSQKKWLKSMEVRKMLSLSPGTLQNMRVNGTLPYSRIGHTLYYDYDDIESILEKNKVSD